ncbi:hypothetical protein, partial [Vibrio vulnificus]|uniref:hypothetical protein n=1 Tax=Vibrio vulnificus TaxID=672 RepID=UPI001A91E884
IAFYHFRNPQLSPSVKDLIVKQEFSSKKSLTSCEGLLYKRQASWPVFCILYWESFSTALKLVKNYTSCGKLLPISGNFCLKLRGLLPIMLSSL